MSLVFSLPRFYCNGFEIENLWKEKNKLNFTTTLEYKASNFPYNKS